VQDMSQNSTPTIVSFTTEFSCIEYYLEEFKYKKREKLYDLFNFKTALFK
jgi:hypothetical protein